MSEENQNLESTVTYDFSKVITGITVSTAYISGISRILTDMVTDYPNPAGLPKLFKKFGTIMQLQDGEEISDETRENIKLDINESNIYTLFSLLQLLRFLAKEQGLEILTETTATKDDLKDLADLVTAGKSTADKIKEINSKMKIVK